MKFEQLRELCLAFPGSVETFPFNATTSVFKVSGKMFALTGLIEPPSINLKCDPGLSEQLREAYPEITPGYHMNKRHWVTVRLDGGLTEQLIGDLVEDSYDLVVESLSRAKRNALSAPAHRSRRR